MVGEEVGGEGEGGGGREEVVEERGRAGEMRERRVAEGGTDRGGAALIAEPCKFVSVLWAAQVGGELGVAPMAVAYE